MSYTPGMLSTTVGIVVLTLLLAASPVGAQDTQPPPAPSSVTVQPSPVIGLNGVTFTLTFPPVLDPPSNTPVPTYTWTAAYSDGQGASGVITAINAPTLNWTLMMPFHCGTSGTCANDAATGFACLKAKDAAGNVSVDQACVPLPVPAKPTAQPSTATVRLSYTEPSTNDCSGTPPPYARGGDCAGTQPPFLSACEFPLSDLKTLRASYGIDGVPQPSIDFLASSPAGGANMSATFTVAQNTGVLVLEMVAIDTCGNTSKPSAPVSEALNQTIPFTGIATFQLITQ